MIYTIETKKAMKLCFEAHKEQTDKTGMPYVFHPFHLAEQMQTEEETVCALLHDIIEDTPYTLEDLRGMGFAERVLDALALLTHAKDVPYMEYVEAIAKNPIAKQVKMADLRHNSDRGRMAGEPIDERMLARWEKYALALEYLENH
ncbi:MAG: GTP pyrophosphokinase [Clostridia bacterium]|nr:GTP pyrophosphokinase [Clostridia bacterium]